MDRPMTAYTRKELDEILKLHQLWLVDNEDGLRADLRGADLRDADLKGVNLKNAILRGANLRGANLVDANLVDANLKNTSLRGADIWRANLRGANLRGANLVGADLVDANLVDANLVDANLVGADLEDVNLRCAVLINSKISDTKFPSPGMVLLANWGELSPELTTLAMAYDRANHPNPERFLEWVDLGGGRCPYNSVNIQRACNFRESKPLYDHNAQSPSAFELMEMILREKTDFQE
jgi:hypothetical protein